MVLKKYDPLAINLHHFTERDGSFQPNYEVKKTVQFIIDHPGFYTGLRYPTRKHTEFFAGPFERSCARLDVLWMIGHYKHMGYKFFIFDFREGFNYKLSREELVELGLEGIICQMKNK